MKKLIVLLSILSVMIVYGCTSDAEKAEKQPETQKQEPKQEQPQQQVTLEPKQEEKEVDNLTYYNENMDDKVFFNITNANNLMNEFDKTIEEIANGEINEYDAYDKLGQLRTLSATYSLEDDIDFKGLSDDAEKLYADVEQSFSLMMITVSGIIDFTMKMIDTGDYSPSNIENMNNRALVVSEYQGEFEENINKFYEFIGYEE